MTVVEGSRGLGCPLIIQDWRQMQWPPHPKAALQSLSIHHLKWTFQYVTS